MTALLRHPRSITIVLALVFTAVTLEAATLKVSSFPSGAQVIVDGVSTGKVTPMNVNVTEGDHVITVQIPNSGWNADIRTVTIVPGNNDLSVTLLPMLTVGPQGPPGAGGPQGIQGIQGPKGDPGITTLADLSSIPCDVSGVEGHITVTVANSGAISLACAVSGGTGGDPEPLVPDAATATAALEYLFRSQTIATPTHCIGSMGTLGTGACIQASSAGVMLTPTSVTLTSATAPFSFDVALNLVAASLQIQYKLVGIPSSCNIHLTAPAVAQGMLAFVSSTAGGPLTRAQVQGIDLNLGEISVSGCSGIAALPFQLLSLVEGLLPNSVFQLNMTACRQADANAFGACPAEP
jgi:hypothetical protein